MFMLLPLMVLVELTFILYSRVLHFQRSIRESFLLAAILIAASATIVAEGLGFGGAINVWTVRGAWFIAAAILAGVFFKTKAFSSWKIQKFSLTWSDSLILGAIIVIALLSAIIAFQCVPNTADSLIYHLPRVMFWAQNGSLAYYPTPVLHQLNYPPGAEFLLLHFFILAGDDKWFNFLQWFAMIGSLVGVSVFAKYLGAQMRGQLFAALVAATLPMGVLQSNSTQTDYVLTLWVIGAAVFMWRAIITEDKVSIVWGGLSFALAVLTKGTAFIALPFVLFLLWKRRSKGFVHAAKILGVLIGIVILLNASYWARNMHSQPSHRIFPVNEGSLLVKDFWPQGVIANMIRHSALHFVTPFDAQLKALHDSVFAIEDRLGIAHDDGRIFSYDPVNAFSGHYVFNEDVAANTMHFILGGGMILIALFFWSKEERVYALCVLAACVLLTGLIKWQPWASRFHLPLFLLAAPLIGMGLSRMRAWGWGVGALLVVLAIYLLMIHPLRPLIGNPNIFTFKDSRMWYFAHIQDESGSYGQAAALVRSSGCKNIGLITGEGSLEYPLWSLISPDRSVRFHYMDVNNFSSSLEKGLPEPCLVLTLDRKEPKVLNLNGKIFLGVWENNYFQLYSKVNVH